MVKKKLIVIELFNNITGEKVRSIRFKTPKEFNHFLNSFNKMRYPGYNWRYQENRRK